MTLRIGCNIPYDARPTEETWRLFAMLNPTEVTISSHESDAVYERLLSEYPGDRLLWHVRAKGNRAWFPKNVDSAEWGNERSLLGRAKWMLERGVIPWLILGNEIDIERAPEPVDDPTNRDHAATAYLNWAAEAIARLRREVPEARIALAPLSQGNAQRFSYWLGRYSASGLLNQVDFWCEHAYTDGRMFEDPDWGGRPLAVRPFGLPVHCCETNDNGRYFAQDPHERADDFAGYAAFLRDSGAVESLSLFTLPGGAQDASKPFWWFIGPEIVTAVREALAVTGAPPVDPPVIVPAPIPPEVPKVVNLIRAVDCSSNNPNRTQAQVNQWVAEGCQLLIVKAYSSAELASLAQTTVEWCRFAKQAGLWHAPYCWLYGSVVPTNTVNSAAQIWRTATGSLPNLIFLDCETYQNSDGSLDLGPTVDQILDAATACQEMSAACAIYTGKWWLDELAKREDISRLAGMLAWIADYRDPPEFTLSVPNPYGLTIVGRQATSTPEDWSVFNLDALAAAIAAAQQQASPPTTPPESTPDALKAALRAELAVLDGVRERIGRLIA